MKEKHLNWIDLAKGIGIILVLIGHSKFLPITLKNYIYSFHMPLFFILSGYVFSNKYNFKDFYFISCTHITPSFLLYIGSFFLINFDISTFEI